jgi:hypothetical protein
MGDLMLRRHDKLDADLGQEQEFAAALKVTPTSDEPVLGINRRRRHNLIACS